MVTTTAAPPIPTRCPLHAVQRACALLHGLRKIHCRQANALGASS